MNENKQKNELKNIDSESDASYLYRWNYGEQVAFEMHKFKKEKRSGVVVYAVVMTTVFLLCFALLLAVLMWYENPFDQSYSNGLNTGMSTGDVAETVKPSTVLVYASSNTSYAYGTGFFINSNGYIATNYHVLSGSDHITVTLYSGKTLEARLVGYSKYDDLAVIKISGSDYPALKIGDSSSLCVGDIAIAVGNPSGTDASWTTTQGIVSALNRNIVVTGSDAIVELTMIQTDAALNHGNSGGPLCNDRGEVIGIVTRKLSDTEGISFAIPINGAMEILNAIMKYGNANTVVSSVSKVRPTIGITGGTIQKGTKYVYNQVEYIAGHDGVFVSTVDSEGAARNALYACDIIIAIDGKTIPDMETLTEMLYLYKVGDQVKITVWRNGEEVTVSVILGNTK